MEIWFCVDQVPDKWTEKGVGGLCRRLISSICRSGKTWPPVPCLTCGRGMKPAGNSPRCRISSGLMAAKLSQVTPGGSFTLTPPCTGFFAPDTPGIGRLARS